MTSKIVVVGSVDGQISSFFGKLSKLHSKHSFSLAIIVGELFADPSRSSPEKDEAVAALLDGKVIIPLTTYFTLGKLPLPKTVVDRLGSSNGELCTNLYFLGKRTTVKTSEGVRIVALGGSLNSEIITGLSQDLYSPFHTEDDAKALRGAHTADILVTSNWPNSIRTGSQVPFPENTEEPPAERCIADLCSTLKPRYHFSTSEQIFYEREPFFHLPIEDYLGVRPITRFISLASFDNSMKQKWLYAFSIDTNASPPLTLPDGVTVSPLLQTLKKRQLFLDQGESYSRFSPPTGQYRQSKRSRQLPPTPAECFFCLSNPNLATHLITSIGTHTYLTTAKGPLTKSSTFSLLDCPSHILIIPLTHSPTFENIGDADERTSTYDEMQKYRHSLHTMLLSRAKSELGAVTWEVSRAAGIHIHWQFLPVPSDLIRKGLVEAAFKVEAENEKYPTFTTKDIGDGSNTKSDYFRLFIWLPENTSRVSDDSSLPTFTNTSNGTEKSLLLPLSSTFRFDLQFGRRVMAKLLQLEKRENWKECMQSEAEEAADAEIFKKVFKEYDFSLEEG